MGVMETPSLATAELRKCQMNHGTELYLAEDGEGPSLCELTSDSSQCGCIAILQGADGHM